MSRLPKSESFTEKSYVGTRKTFSRSFRELSGFVSGETDNSPISEKRIDSLVNQDTTLTRGKIKEDVYIELYLKICALSMENERLRYKGVRTNGVQDKSTEPSAEKDRKIESLNQAIDTKDDIINNLNGQIDRFKDKVANLEAQLSETRRIILEKELAINRLNDKENQNSTQNSNHIKKTFEEKKHLVTTIDGLTNRLETQTLEYNKELCYLRREINDIKIRDGQKILELQRTIKNVTQEKTAIQGKVEQLKADGELEKQNYEKKLTLFLNRFREVDVNTQLPVDFDSHLSLNKRAKQQEMSPNLTDYNFIVELGPVTNDGTSKASHNSSFKQSPSKSFIIDNDQTVSRELNGITSEQDKNQILNKEAQLEQLLQTSTSTRQQIEARDQELRELKNGLLSKDQRLKELDDLIGQLRAQITSISKKHDMQIAELSEKLIDFEEQIAEKEKDCLSLEAEIDGLNKFYDEQLDVTKDLLNVNVSKIEAQKAEIESLKKVIRMKEEMEVELREQYTAVLKAKNTEDELTINIKSLESRIKELSAEILEKNNQITELKSSKDKDRIAYETELAKLTDHLTTTKNQLTLQSEDYEKQILDRDIAYQELDEHRAKLMNELTVAGKIYQDKIDTLEKTIQGLSMAKQSLVIELQNRSNEIEKLTNELDTERVKRASADTEVDESHQQISKYQINISQLKSELTEHKHRLNLLAQEKEELAEIIHQLQSLQDESKGTLEKSSRRNELRQQEIELRYESEVSELKLKITDLESNVAFQSAQLKSYKEKADHMSAKLLKREEEYQESLSSNNMLSIQIKKLENQLALSQQQLDDLEDIQAITRKNYEEKITNLIEAHKLELQAAETDKRRTMAAQTHELARLKEDNQRIRLQFLDLESQMGHSDKLDQDLRALRATIAQLQAEKVALQDILEDERHKHIETIKQFEEMVQKNSHEHTSRLLEIQQENEDLHIKMKTLQSTLRTIPSGVQFPQSSEFQNQSVGMTEVLDNSNNQEAQLNSDSEIGRNGTNIFDLQHMIDKLKEELHENRVEWECLHNEFAGNLASFQNWEKERDELMTENMRLQILGEDKGKQIENLVCRNDQLLFKIFQLSTLNCLLLKKCDDSK